MKRFRTVFYSWQADLPNRTNRAFIEDALGRVISAWSADDPLKIDLRLDRDTADVAGSPAIADTILQKIANAELFVPDVSLVARTADGKACPNPNVLLELGFAVARLGWDRIIMVMNTAFGDIADLPFDLRGRRVMPYFVPDEPGSSKADERRKLEDRLKVAVAAILGEQGAREQAGLSQERERLVEWARQFHDSRVAQIRKKEGPSADFVSDNVICIHVVPVGAVSGRIALAVNELDPRATFLPPFGSTGFDVHFNGDGLLRIDSEPGQLNSYLQIFRGGTIESVNGQMLNGRRMRGDGLPSEAFCRSLGMFVLHTVKVFRAVDIAPPACVLVTLVGLKDRPLLVGANGGYYSRPFDRDAITLPAAIIDDYNEDPRPLLRPMLDVLWQHAGEDGCPFFLSDGTWNLRDLF